MEGGPSERLEYLSRPYNFIKKCTNCGSIYVNERECEGCGYQLKDPELGSPVDERSFYSIRDEYKNSQNFFEFFFLRTKSNKYKDYRNRIIHRYNSLLKGMESPWTDLDKWNYFHFELLDLTKYLSSFSSNDIFMDRIIASIRNHPFFYEIKSAREISKQAKIKLPILSKDKKILLFIFLISIFLILMAPLILSIKQGLFKFI